MIEKNKRAFQEEAREILVELESTLLELNEQRSDTELIGRAFRSLHTIKGSGSMFGFQDIVLFTHDLETAFDEVRNGSLSVTTELVDLTLAALDQIRAMLDQAGGRGTADQKCSADILDKLQHLNGRPQPQPVEGATPSSLKANTSPHENSTDEAVRDWHICFRPGPDLMRNGNDPLLLLRDLRSLGSLRIRADLTAIPPLIELDPERCYIAWDMELTTSAAREEIFDVFIFVEGSCELSISPVLPEPAAAPAASVVAASTITSPNAPEGARKFGRRAEDNAANIRVPAVKLDQFVDLVGELVTVQARLAVIASRIDDPELVTVSEGIESLTSALRENSMSIRMLPIRGTFERFRRLIHDLARDLHKDVELVTEGAETELDKTVIDQLNDPLMHLVRNSMDHGVEPLDVRIAAGKRPTATIKLSARHSGANVLISIADDGAGINAEAVRERAIEKGLIAADVPLAEPQIFSLIMAAGFSTAQKVTDLSGRGVGMDVVRQTVEGLRGSIEVASKPGAGTSVTLRLPLTMAIIDGLLVRVDDAYFVLPLSNTLECIELTREDIEIANGKHIANVRGEVIPYIRLREYFGVRTERPQIEQIMIAETEQGHFGFVVDEVLGDHQTVIKNLGRLYRDVPFVSGATILGSGAVALILDPNRLVQEAIRAVSVEARRRPSLAAAPRASSYAKDGQLLNSS